MRRILFIIATVAVIASCTGGKVYDHYEHTPIAGWDKVDMLSYDVPALPDSGFYSTTLGLRINGYYPYQKLTLIVEQTVIHDAKVSKSSPVTFTDTLNCTLFDRKGEVKGQGVSYYQYHFRISERHLAMGDSLHVTVHHDMQREIMPGIADIGIIVARTKE